ncbi:hypothetical protein CPT_Seuss41 [Caulobacter phage Seuss]|uniref:Uncharacterized protein n=1 Tax=Caulobacter phage Seuss TaxID=1675601 RepID=A0A0K1LM23_9CAUD|nr:hypothetical protein HOR08_gp041 [Caulobacter phage Seuss]AKU43567.1 hypothetical protein CPT_Seuss41 [Caulobacter phage Seuss]
MLSQAVPLSLMAKPTGIIAYGRPEDRLKLAAIAKSEGVTSSRWIVDQIRKRYRELYAETPPENLTGGGEN